jgi:ABC-type lipoprotein export system ATPase subunit
LNKHAFITIQEISKRYTKTSSQVLENINLNLNLGTSLSILGKSGCGKSTLLYIIGLLDKPTGGQYRLNNIDMLALNRSQQAKMRNQYFGFIFQEHRLIPYLSILDNVRLPFYYRQEKIVLTWEKYVFNKLEIVGLEKRCPHELSVGQQQRVAIARSLISRPTVILADEPTASLDEGLAAIYMNMLLEYVEERQALYIMVTHDKALAMQAQHQFYLK